MRELRDLAGARDLAGLRNLAESRGASEASGGAGASESSGGHEAPEGSRGPDMVIVEASTAEQALQQVSARFGAQADILGATKVLRGGLAGFFAKEMIQLRVRATAADAGAHDAAGGGATAGDHAGGAASTPPPVADWTPAERTPAVERLLSALTGSVDERERAFASALRSELADHPDLGAAPTEGPPAPAGGAAGVRPVGAEAAGPSVSAGGAAGVRPVGAEAAVTQRLGDERVGRAAAPAAAWPSTRQPLAPKPLASQPLASQPLASQPSASQPLVARRASGQPSSGPTPVAAPPAMGAAPVSGAGATATAGAPAALGDPLEVPASPLPPAGPLDRAVWCPQRLARLGLPRLVLDALAGVDGDLEGLQAASEAVASLCRPLPAGVPLLAGPHADALSVQLAIPLVVPPGPTPASGPVAAAVGEGHSDWLRGNGGGRWLHLVVGGSGWEALADHGPLAVSCAAPADLPAALRLAADGGLVLGHLGGRARRASPVDVAVALRELLVAA